MKVNIKVGDIVRTSYGSQTGYAYKVVSMTVCNDYGCAEHYPFFAPHDKELPPGRPHLHLTCKAVYPPDMDNPRNIEPPRQNFYLNNYDPETLRCIGPADGKLDDPNVAIPWQNDYLIVIQRSEIPMQETLF